MICWNIICIRRLASSLPLLIIFVLLNQYTYANENRLKVFIFAGQSNMLGKRGVENALPKHLMNNHNKNLIFDGLQWVDLKPVSGQYQKKGFGPEVSFAFEISKQLGEPIGVIKHSVGGTNLAQQWSPSVGDSNYARLLKKIDDAKKTKNIEILGTVWMQGESDAKNANMAKNYGNNLAALVAALRADLRLPNMVFVAGLVNPLPLKRFPYSSAVRAAQSDNSIKAYSFVNCDDLPKVADRLHYSTQGIVELGYRFAGAVLPQSPSSN